MKKVIVGNPWTIGLDGSPGQTEIHIRGESLRTMGGEKEDLSFDDLLIAAKLYNHSSFRITIEEGKLTIELAPD